MSTNAQARSASGPARWQEHVKAEIEKRTRSDLLRVPRVLKLSESAIRVTIQTGSDAPLEMTLYSTNDYLGLSNHPDVKRAVADAAIAFGTGTRSSAIVAGHSALHDRLETELAALKKTQACLLFPTGFAANMAAISALASDGQVAIFSDMLNHASLIDGCRFAKVRGADVHLFKHRDYGHLRELLQRHQSKQRSLVITDGVFSMDGDVADLQELARLRESFGFLLLVDDAHGTLVKGTYGGGVAEQMRVSSAVDIHVGTLSKAFGSHGGFVACSHAVKALLVNQGRPYIYSTALPAPCVAGALAALHTMRREKWRVSHLVALQNLVSAALAQPVQSPIVPIMVGDPELAVAISDELFKRGFHVPAIRPPTVPEGTSRLRLSLSADHSQADVRNMLDVLRGLMVK